MENQYLYLDESGDSGWPQSVGGSSTSRYFIYAGVILTPEQNYDAKEELNQIITDHFSGIGLRQPEEIHYADAVHGKERFGQLSNDELSDLRDDLFDLILAIEPTLMATVIDKRRMKEEYGDDAFPPKRYSFRGTIDRFHKHLSAEDAIGVVTIDAAESTFDRRLRDLVYQAQNSGIKLPGADSTTDSFLPRIMDTITMTPSEMSPGIQLADIVAYQVQNQYRHGDSHGFDAISHLFRDPDNSRLTEPSEVPAPWR